MPSKIKHRLYEHVLLILQLDTPRSSSVDKHFALEDCPPLSRGMRTSSAAATFKEPMIFVCTFLIISLPFEQWEVTPGTMEGIWNAIRSRRE